VIQNVGYGGIKWTDMTFMAAYLLMAWACQRYATDPPPPGERERPSAAGGARVQPFTLLPYVAVVLCYGLLVAEAFKRPGERWAFLAIGCVAITCLVVLRQLAAVRENARLVSETAARENEARFRALVQHSTDVIAIADAEGVLRYVSPSIQRLFGYQPSDLEGKPLVDFLHPDDAVQAAAAFMTATDPGSVTAPAEWRIRHRDGRWLAIEAVGTNLLHEPTVRGIVVNARDVSDRKALEGQLTHQAFHDPLTGLANRALFFDRVTHALERRERMREGLAVLFLDLDNFKTVNDSLGHAAGDRLLVAAAVRLGVCVRASDTVARLGGDEFAVLIEDATGDLASVAAERITAALRAPFELEGNGINDDNVISGEYFDPGAGQNEGWIWTLNGTGYTIVLSPKSGGPASAFDTNVHGITTVQWEDVISWDASLYNDNTFNYTAANVPGAANSYIHAIDDSGDTVYSWQDSSGFHGAVQIEGTFTTFNGPGCSGTYADGINNNHIIVGQCAQSDTVGEGFYVRY